MNNNIISLSAEIHEILLNYEGDGSGIEKISEFILENFSRKQKVKQKIPLIEGSQKYLILDFMVKNPDEWVYAKTFQDKNIFGGALFIGYESGSRLSEINSFGYFESAEEKKEGHKRPFKKFRIKSYYLQSIKNKLNSNGILPRLKK